MLFLNGVDARIYLFFCCCLSVNSYAHQVGVTESSIEIAEPGVRIIYSVPAHALAMLTGEEDNHNKTASAGSADKYISLIAGGWRVSASVDRCKLVNTLVVEASDEDVYLYQLDYQCRSSLSRIAISYSLFQNHASLSYKNRTKIKYGTVKSQLDLGLTQNQLNIPVAIMLEKHQSRLEHHFTLSINGEKT